VHNIQKSKNLKAVEDEFEWTEQVVFEKVMPEDEQRKQWELLLLLLLLSQNTQVWKTAMKQLQEVYGMTGEFDDLKANFVNRQATSTASGISKTVFKRVREVIQNDLNTGVRDLRQIKLDIAGMLKDQKEWKIDQIAQTEVARAYGEAQMQMYKDNHVEKVIWLVGSAPCEICRENADKVVTLGQSFPSGHTNEPVHPHCRCSVEPYPY
jgi:hypothetical protein